MDFDKHDVETLTGAKTATAYILCLRADSAPEPGADLFNESLYSVLMVQNIPEGDKPEGFGFPGGGTEYGENIQQTAIRECKEETGIAICSCREAQLKKGLRWLVPRRHDSPRNHEHYNVLLGPVSYCHRHMGEIEVDDPEGGVIKAEWVPLNDIREAVEWMRRDAEPQDARGRRYYRRHLAMFDALVSCN